MDVSVHKERQGVVRTMQIRNYAVPPNRICMRPKGCCGTRHSPELGVRSVPRRGLKFYGSNFNLRALVQKSGSPANGGFRLRRMTVQLAQAHRTSLGLRRTCCSRENIAGRRASVADSDSDQAFMWRFRLLRHPAFRFINCLSAMRRTTLIMRCPRRRALSGFKVPGATERRKCHHPPTASPVVRCACLPWDSGIVCKLKLTRQGFV